MTSEEVERQRAYYASTAEEYERLHVHANDEHGVALAWLAGLIRHLGIRSVLDVGCGTGRALRYLAAHCPGVTLAGVEPSPELRAIARGLCPEHIELSDGDATRLAQADASYDVVCEFGMLHHVAQPRLALNEMLRTARIGIFVSDDNHFAAGGATARRVKRTLRALGLWRLAYRLRTGGKGYRISAGDGLSYPYSVFDDLDLYKQHCAEVLCTGLDDCGADLLRSAQHVAVFGRKHSAAGDTMPPA